MQRESAKALVHVAGKAVPGDTSSGNEGDSDMTVFTVLVDQCEVACHSEMIDIGSVV